MATYPDTVVGLTRELIALRARLEAVEQEHAAVRLVLETSDDTKTCTLLMLAENMDAALIAARQERDRLLLQVETEKGGPLCEQLALAKERNAALLAENRALVGIIEDMDGLAYGFDTTELAPLTTAEVERVRKLERVAEAAKEYRKAVQSMYDNHSSLEHDSNVFSRAMFFDAALAALEGE